MNLKVENNNTQVDNTHSPLLFCLFVLFFVLPVQLWDIAMEREPVKVVQVHEHLRPRLCDLYENDCIFDKFECSINHDATQIMSGTYGKRFRVFDTTSQDEVVLTASRPAEHSRPRSPPTRTPTAQSSRRRQCTSPSTPLKTSWPSLPTTTFSYTLKKYFFQKKQERNRGKKKTLNRKQ